MNRMMLSCNKATLLIEKKLDTRLSFGELLQLRFHTSMCKGCTNYLQQSFMIDALLKKHASTDETVADFTDLRLSKAEKDELRRRLRSKM